MNSKKKTGGPVYSGKRTIHKPHGYDSYASNYVEENYPGNLTVLDHFAGLAMQGWLSTFDINTTHPATGNRADERVEKFAQASYKLAAAMIAERERIMNETPEQP